MNFYSVEIIYYGAGSVIIWLRRFTGKSKNDIVQVLKRTLFDLSSYEVLEIYPYPELVQNDWFISTMRIFNNFMLGKDFKSYLTDWIKRYKISVFHTVWTKHKISRV